jgi:RNA recognition motif-containing protein
MEPSINSSNSLSDPEVQASGYKKFWVGGIPPRTQKDALKASFIEAFDITDANIVDQIQVIIKLGYGFVTIPTKFTSSIT